MENNLTMTLQKISVELKYICAIFKGIALTVFKDENLFAFKWRNLTQSSGRKYSTTVFLTRIMEFKSVLGENALNDHLPCLSHKLT